MIARSVQFSCPSGRDAKRLWRGELESPRAQLEQHDVQTVDPGPQTEIVTSDEAHAYAMQWAEAWNNRNIEQVLDHFHDDVEFTSPTAMVVMGVPTMKGKGALREYWTNALSRISSLRFALDRVLWDSTQRELAIIYTAEINAQSRRVSENLRFNDSNQVMAAEVFQGIAW